MGDLLGTSRESSTGCGLESPQGVAHFGRGELSSVSKIGPGALSVSGIEDARLILDPNINFVRITRNSWQSVEGAAILSGLQELLSRAPGLLKCDHYWDGPEATLLSESVRAGVIRVLGPVAVQQRYLSVIEYLTEDLLRLRQCLADITGARESMRSNLRFEHAVDAPVEHCDAQLITCGCTYCGGGTIVKLCDGTALQLEPGEVGLWKGDLYNDEVFDDSEVLLKEGDGKHLNPGQGLLHSASALEKDYPRLVVLHDIRDRIPPVELLRGFAPWI